MVVHIVNSDGLCGCAMNFSDDGFDQYERNIHTFAALFFSIKVAHMRWTRLVPLSSGHHFLTTKHLPRWETEILFGKPNSLNRSFGASEAFSPNPNSLTPKTILKARDGHQNRSVPQLLRSGNLDPTVLVGEVQCILFIGCCSRGPSDERAGMMSRDTRTSRRTSELLLS